MKLIFLITIILLLSSCSTFNCQTEACLQYAIEQEKLEMQEAKEQREHNLKVKELEAKIEAAKPIPIRVAEIQTSKDTMGESVVDAALVTGGIYVGAKLIDVLFE